MRAGRLDKPADILVLHEDLGAEVLDWLWVDIASKEAADAPAHAGLRAPAKVSVRSWWDERLLAGRYLRFEGRLLLIDDVRDFNGDQVEVVITASELVGVCGEARPDGRAPRSCRVFIRFDVPFRGDHELEPVLRTYAEVALIEAGRLEAEDQLLVEGVLYNVLSLVKDTDDGVVRGLWLERVE